MNSLAPEMITYVGDIGGDDDDDEYDENGRERGMGALYI